ncbi:multicopper oxidase domain-containing protein [Aquabacter sp. CN5-332]|uniref:multicopper oxidase family protein n=1 Tax=Aquabacter sp. CN5-332 TaxID=3156608 RepID=UPI0032B36C37
MTDQKGREERALPCADHSENHLLPETSLSRRGFLAAGAAGILAPSLAGTALAQGAGPAAHGSGHGMTHGGPAITPTQDAPLDPYGARQVRFPENAPLKDPEVRSSANGVLETTLRASYDYHDVGGYRLYLRNYEGMIPGPTLRVKPGDVLKIRLINDLPPNRDQMPEQMNQPHLLNTTNFHFHGSHVSPSGIADNVMRSMHPGQSYDVEIAIPVDHTRGLAWYHPHHHGSADIQIASGMAGAIVIEGDFADVPEIAAAKERVLVLGEVVFDAHGMVEGFDTVFSETSVRFLTLNGQRAPMLTMRPGEVQRWRLLHAGYQDDLFLLLAQHQLIAIARDGIGLSTMGMGEVRTDQKDLRDALLIGPGQRIDVLVKAGAPGIYDLKALPYNQGYPSPSGLIARLKVEGEPLPMNLPARLPPPPLATIRDEEITNRRQLTFSAIVPENEAAANWREFRFQVDGKSFDMNRVDQRVKLGAVEEWTIKNLHFHDHIFHIHTNPFQLVKVNGEAVAPVWLDTVVLPRYGSVTLRSRFLDFTGKFMLHCHMMNHEELGMMQVVEVYDGA